ncbi:6,7-dimethyl-8-ribityllumazine synthase [candidate division KSB1 bacterium]|nr:6,7-dimethyl-8-ribityllumazine synthase [bacterium]RKY86944.1 MAG: 6,7-dimethyl-8-ribityllumazine synthase [candidate division KSB1 bacterium]RKY89577.1 MAG: 6,7-dimethyl-8-ribityllumazine synthase [candidate division KSB1 bacterium]HDI51681.1 6,7-dimethyl-8-ribityllumazine synthase [Bacteroidota bacterium]
MPKFLEGQLKADGKRFGLVASRFNELVVKKLVEGAVDCIVRHGGADKDIDVAWVPGSFEIPAVANRMVQSGKYDAVICLGAVLRGATPHFDYIASEVTKGIGRIALQSPVPTVYGIITADTLEQALERAGTKMGNKGWDAALSAIEMINLFQKI